MTGTHMRRGKFGYTGTQGKHHVNAEAETRVMCLSSKKARDCQHHQKK